MPGLSYSTGLGNYVLPTGGFNTTGGTGTGAATQEADTTGKSGKGWDFFAAILPSLFGAASNTIVGKAAADAEREKARNGWFNNPFANNFNPQTGMTTGGGGGWGWIIGGVLILGIVLFVVMKSKGK